MNHRVAICAGVAALGLAASAQAQTVYVEPPNGLVAPPPAMVQSGLPASEILMLVRASGLTPLTRPARQGPRYVLLASDNMGGQLRVVIGAYDGRILHASPAYDPRFAYQPMRPRGLIPVRPPHLSAAPAPPYGAPPPPELKDPTQPPRTAHAPQAPAAPSGTAQTARLASAPDITHSVPSRPARTPLPRPRPALAADAAAAAPSATTQAAVRETSPEAETPPAAAPAQARPTQMVPVAPLD